MPLEDHIALRKSFPFSKLTKLLTAALLVFAVLHGVMVGVRLWLYSILGSTSVDEWGSTEDFVDNVNIVGGYILIGIFLVTAVLFLVWFHRARRNIDVLEAEGVGYGTGGAVGWWFVPFANLVMPYRIARDIWTASNPATYRPGYPTAWLTDDKARPVTLWWTFWLIAFFLDRMTNDIYKDVVDLDRFREMLIQSSVVDIVAIVAAWFAVRFVRGVCARQEKRYAVMWNWDSAGEGEALPDPLAA